MAKHPIPRSRRAGKTARARRTDGRRCRPRAGAVLSCALVEAGATEATATPTPGAGRAVRRRTTRAQIVALPLEGLPKLLMQFALEAAQAIGCPVDYVVGFMLAIAGAAIGTNAVVEIKPGWVEPGLLWLVGIGLSGDGKTPALRAVTQPLYDMQEEAWLKWRREYGEWLAALVAFKDGKGPPPGPSPTLDRLFLDDTTVEAIAPELCDKPKGFPLVNDELSAWVRGMGQYKKGGGDADRSFWMKSWAMQPWSVTRKGHKGPPLIVLRPFVPVVGGIQSDLLAELVDERGREDGFLARVLPVFPPSLPVPCANDFTISPDAEGAWHHCIRRLRKLPVEYKDGKLTPRILPFTDAAQHEYNAFLDTIAAEVNASTFPIALRAPWLKLRSYGARLALTLQGMRWACGEADFETSVRGAIALVGAFKTHIKRVYRQLPATPGDRKSDGVYAWVRKRGTEVSPRDVARYGVAGITKPEEARAVLEGLVERGLLERHEHTTGHPRFSCPHVGGGDE